MVTRTWGEENEVDFYLLPLASIPFCLQTDANDSDCEGVGTRWKTASNTLFRMPCPTPISSKPGNENAYLQFRAGSRYGNSRRRWHLDKPVPLQEQGAWALYLAFHVTSGLSGERWWREKETLPSFAGPQQSQAWMPVLRVMSSGAMYVLHVQLTFQLIQELLLKRSSTKHQLGTTYIT